MGRLIQIIVCFSFLNVIPITAEDNSSVLKDRFQEFVDTASNAKYVNWYNLDYHTNRIMGISTDKTYTDFLDGKKSNTVIIAVIDGGIDINHTELKGKIWVNEGEIPDNGIDDDSNGYIDDVNGWNFIGNQYNENIGPDNFELTTLVRKYAVRFDSVTTNNNLLDNKDYLEYLSLKDEFNTKLELARAELKSFKNFRTLLDFQDSVLMDYFGKSIYTMSDIKSVRTRDKSVKYACHVLTMLNKMNITPEYLNEYKQEAESKVYFQLNPEYESRSLVGDNVEDITDICYGNNDVVGPYPEHGTMVAGIIAANREDGTEMKGIANDVKIMALRVVPDGDEYDKDVALAIRYAVDNGAQIINMSFGKKYSPNKAFVDSAILYAQSKQVLLIHACGNEGQNIDLKPLFPTDIIANDNTNPCIVNNWISVGASDLKPGKTLPASFSNYGMFSVDVFAPGVNIYSLAPNNKYATNSGTSCAAPVVAGMAAILKSYYPYLSASEILDIIIQSALPIDYKVSLPADVDNPSSGKKKNMVPFTELCASGGIVNLYRAVQLAEEITKPKN